jgi:hypothetical protein
MGRIIGICILFRPQVPKHQGREEDVRFVGVPYNVPISEDLFRFSNQSLHTIAVKVIGEVIIGNVSLILQASESASH